MTETELRDRFRSIEGRLLVTFVWMLVMQTGLIIAFALIYR